MKGASNKETPHAADIAERLLALCNTVEGLFADAVVSFLDSAPRKADGLRTEDYRAHEQCMEIDRDCLALMASDEASAERVQFLAASMKIAGGLKRVADESLQVGRSLRECEPADFPEAGPLPEMIELTQSMLGDVVEAFVNSDAKQAAALHLIFRELADLRERAEGELVGAMEAGRTDIATGTALHGVASRLLRVADEVVGIGNQVSHLYRGRESG
jgi:phosphate transport system protein